MFFGFDIALAVLAFLVILIIFAGVKQIPQGYNYTVERFGKFTKTLKPVLLSFCLTKTRVTKQPMFPMTERTQNKTRNALYKSERRRALQEEISSDGARQFLTSKSGGKVAEQHIL